MKVAGYTLEIDGELAPMWFHVSYFILKNDAHALLPPHGDAKIRKVNLTINRQRKKK